MLGKDCWVCEANSNLCRYNSTWRLSTISESYLYRFDLHLKSPLVTAQLCVNAALVQSSFGCCHKDCWTEHNQRQRVCYSLVYVAVHWQQALELETESCTQAIGWVGSLFASHGAASLKRLVQ